MEEGIGVVGEGLNLPYFRTYEKNAKTKEMGRTVHGRQPCFAECNFVQDDQERGKSGRRQASWTAG